MRRLGKLPVPGRPTNLDYSRARAYCACSRCEWGLFGHFFSLIYHFSYLTPSLWETARYRLKYFLKGSLSPKQPTNQPKLNVRAFRTSTAFTYCLLQTSVEFTQNLTKTLSESSVQFTQISTEIFRHLPVVLLKQCAFKSSTIVR